MSKSNTPQRRDLLIAGTSLMAAAATALSGIAEARPAKSAKSSSTKAKQGAKPMHDDSFVTTKDGVKIYYKDWGPKSAQPIVFHHGWPLSADDWDTQMIYFLAQGYRTVAFDRRGHGRSTQVSEGHDMDHYAADANAVVEALDLKNAVHIGHSTGGGQVARYVAKFGGNGRVAKAIP
jgi:non-heme chloroperoxidase